MRIVMKTNSAGPEGTRWAGKEYDVPDKEAKELIDGKYAEPAKSKKVERATAEPDGEDADSAPETETKPHSRKSDDIEKATTRRK
jgi:hypothetical protein